MREYITADDVCNQIMMNRSVFKGTVMVIEGNTDYRLYNKFTDKDVKIIPAHSKDNVLKVIRKMTSRKEGKILAIIDRDLDDLKGKHYDAPVFQTDLRDMEMMLIDSEAFMDVLAEYADEGKLERFQSSFGDIRDAVISGSYPVGLLMYVSYLRGMNLCFKDLDFSEFINRKDLSCDVRRMVSAVVSNTTNCRVGESSLIKDLSAESRKHTEKREIARGHDTVKVLLMAIKDNVGSYNVRSLNEDSLSGALRLAYSDRDFSMTDLYKRSGRWAESKGLALWKLNLSRSLRS